MKDIIIKLALVSATVLTALIFIQCGKGSPEDNYEPPIASYASCEGCHTNYAHLQKVYSPDTAVTGGGCGGEAPHYEPYDRVFMGGDGYELYKQSRHYSLGCVACHNGIDNTDDKNLAHSGDFLSHPSDDFVGKCEDCHSDQTRYFANSIHTGVGQKRKVCMRSGLNGPDDFDQLPAHQQEGYNNNCATCHGNCGNCHVVRPPSGGGGLTNGHNFSGSPDMVSICVTCHTSRGGHAYFGVAPGTKPDVHLSDNKFTCMDCHNGAELHGSSQKVEQRYEYNELPSCDDCHDNLQASNNYHSEHIGDFSCYVCHSQDYNNCAQCHVHDGGAQIPAYIDYKIARNPLPDLKKGFEFALVRRAPGAPENWKHYGVEYSNFDVLPTYNYTSPHNILKVTSRTDVGGGDCYSNCHIKNDNGTLVNEDLYLFKSDLLQWEVAANDSIVCDDYLPASWFK
jgi:hypothetical protein